MAGTDDSTGKHDDGEHHSAESIEIESGWESIPPPEPSPTGAPPPLPGKKGKPATTIIGAASTTPSPSQGAGTRTEIVVPPPIPAPPGRGPAVTKPPGAPTITDPGSTSKAAPPAPPPKPAAPSAPPPASGASSGVMPLGALAGPSNLSSSPPSAASPSTPPAGTRLPPPAPPPGRRTASNTGMQAVTPPAAGRSATASPLPAASPPAKGSGTAAGLSPHSSASAAHSTAHSSAYSNTSLSITQAALVQPGKDAGPAAVMPDVIAPAGPVLEEPLAPPAPASPDAELRSRSERIAKSDPVAAARALVELGIYEERINHDRKAAKSCYQAARGRVRSLEPALARLRRLSSGKAELPQILPIIDDELLVAQGEVARADLLAERARICDALGKTADSRASYTEALRLAPLHAASLRGLEIVLRRELAKTPSKPLANELATHLERIAEAYAPGPERQDGDALLTAWVLVERAHVLDVRLAEADLARAALERAVSFVPTPGPVRDALTRHLVRHGNLTVLVRSLSIEADQEQDHDRASRLLYTSARLLADKFDGQQDAIKTYTRAQVRAPGTTPTAQRVLIELIRMLEAVGENESASEARQKRLALLTDTDAIVHEHIRLSELYDALGHAERSAGHAMRALELDPESTGTRERLDRAYQRLGRHEERMRVWASVADGTARPMHVRVAALMRAADIAERNLRRREEAIAHLRAAWATDPGNTSVFDALSVLLSPASRDPDSDPRNVRARLDLYTQAAHATTDPARKIGLLEKLASIWEDELYQPARAVEEIEKILAIEPSRRSAILALQRNAARAQDAVRLSRALQAEADLTNDRQLQKKLLLQAADVASARLGDRDRALFLVDRALAVDPTDPDALRARQRIDERAGRHDEARKALLRLIAREGQGEAAFALWLEVAMVDEQRLKRPRDAVEAYRQAARVKPNHPLPRVEIARLLREIGDYGKLVEALMGLAASATDANDYARLLFEAAEVQELKLGNDEAALSSLNQADAHLPADGYDPAILEAMERIYVRRGSHAELAALYSRWLDRKPPAPIDHALRVALASVLADSDKRHAVDLLSALISVVPGHAPALRLLEQIYRSTNASAALAATLRGQADVFASRLARVGALWELVSLEEEIGASATLESLERLVGDAPTDTSALDAVVRIAGKLVDGMGPHPTVMTVRAKLIAALQARKELAADPVTRAMLQIEEAILAEARIQDEPALARAARDGYRDALSLWPDSLLAARGLDRMAPGLGDRACSIMANMALAKLVDSARERAMHLVRAAELTAEDGSPQAQARALDLYEQALAADADSDPAARSIARMLANDPGRLIDRLGEAIQRATVKGQIVLLGTEIGQSVLRHKDAPIAAPEPGHGVSAMRRVLAVAPSDVPSLLLMARLLVAQRVWSEAQGTLLRVVEVGTDLEPIIAAQFMLADIYEGPLADLTRAEQALQAILAVDGGNRRALEKLVQVATARGDGALAIQAIGRLVEIAPDPSSRVDADMWLAEACRKEGDSVGMVRALSDALASAPNDPRPMAAFARLYRTDTHEGASSYVKALQQTIEIANARRLQVDARWLMTVGLLQATVLMRPREGVQHLQQAATLPGAPADVRTALGRGLEAANRNGEAITVLRDALATEAETIARVADLGPALGALDAALAKEGRIEERLAVEEVRACLGEVKADRVAWLRARRLPAEVPPPLSLTGQDLARLLVPEAKSPMIDVAVAIAPIAAKALRFEMGSLGVSSRERIGPRDGHPTRLLADRLARALGLEAFELYLTPTWKGAARAYPGDPPAIVGPTSFAELPEPEQLFGLSRLMVRAALGFSWLDELSIEAADGLLLAALRSVLPAFGSGELTPAREQAVQALLVPVQKAIGRRQRKLLEEIAPNASAAYDPRALNIGVRRSEYRIAYLMAGDLLAAVDYLRRFDREIGRSAEEPRVLLQHPVTNELLRYALTAEAYAERRRIGTG